MVGQLQLGGEYERDDLVLWFWLGRASSQGITTSRPSDVPMKMPVQVRMHVPMWLLVGVPTKVVEGGVGAEGLGQRCQTVVARRSGATC